MAGSMANQKAQLQAEVSPGTPITTAMKRLQALKLMPAWNVDGGESFRASGYKVPTAYMDGDMWGVWGVDGILDYNCVGYPAKCVLGVPVSGLVSGATAAYQHVFTPKPGQADTLSAFTAQWGEEGVRAIQAALFVFQSLGLSVERGSLSMSSGAISKTPDETATLATTGVTVVEAIPVNKTKFDVYLDTSWANLGTSKALGCYAFEITNPDKYAPDAPINSAINGFQSLDENDDIDYGLNFSLAFDASGAAMVGKFKSGDLVYMRVAVQGPLIEGSIYHTIAWDFCLRLTGVGQVAASPNGKKAILPFTSTMHWDKTADKFQELKVVNKIAAY